MSKKIVIEPYFNEAHLARHHIGNLCEYLKPDVYVIAEGLFPAGPEVNKGTVPDHVIQQYTLNGEGKRSFDFEELQKIVADYRKQYPHIEFYIVENDYTGLDVTECFGKAYTSFEQVIKPEVDDIIFPSECDVFITEEQGKKILKLCETLEPNQAFCCTYLLFFESPRIHWAAAMSDARRIAYRYGSGRLWGNYDGVPGTPSMYGLDPVHPLNLFHYKWIRPNRYWDFRKEQIVRNEEWERQIEKVRSIIKEHRHDVTNINNKLAPILQGRFYLSSLTAEDHPKHFREHESFVYYYG